MAAAQFLRDLVAAVPYQIHTVLTDNGIQFTNRAKDAAFAHIFGRLSRRARHRASPDQGEPPMDQRPGRRMNRTRPPSGAMPTMISSGAISATSSTPTTSPAGSGGLTPFEFICKLWTSEPQRFHLDPAHQMPGLNT